MRELLQRRPHYFVDDRDHTIDDKIAKRFQRKTAFGSASAVNQCRLVVFRVSVFVPVSVVTVEVVSVVSLFIFDPAFSSAPPTF